MAALTWRNVDAPDFRPSIEGYKTFSDLLGNALSTAKGGLTEFDNRITDEARNKLALQFAAIQDPEQAKAALAALGSDPNASRYGAQDIALASARPNQLIAQASGALGLTKDQYGFDRVKTNDLNSDAAKPGIAAMAAVYSNPNSTPAEIAAARAIAGPTIAMLDPASIMAAYQGAQNIEKGTVGISSDRIGVKQSQFNLDVGVRDDADKQNGLRAAQAIQAASMDPETARTAFTSGAYKDLSPGAKAYAQSQLNGTFGNIFGPDNSTGGGSATAGGEFTMGDAQKAVAGELSNGGMSSAVVAGFLGNFHLEGGYSGKAGDGGQARGIAQWHPDRQAQFKQVIGKSVEDASPAEQAKFVNWEMKNPTKAGMTVAQRDAILAAKTPEEAAALIDKHYERSSGEVRNGRVAAASQAAQLMSGRAINQAAGQAGTLIDAKTNENNATSIASDIPKGITQSSKLSDVSAALIANDFKGVPRNWVEDQLIKIQKQTGKGYDIAAAILSRNLGGSADSGITRVNRYFFGGPSATPNLPGGRRLNDAGIAASIEEVRNGSAFGRVASNQNNEMRKGEIAAATAAVNAAQAKLAAITNRAATQPQLAAQIPRYQAAYDNARRNAQALLMDNVGSKDKDGSSTFLPKVTPKSPTGTAATAAKFGQMWDDILSGNIVSFHRGK